MPVRNRQGVVSDGNVIQPDLYAENKEVAEEQMDGVIPGVNAPQNCKSGNFIELSNSYAILNEEDENNMQDQDILATPTRNQESRSGARHTPSVRKMHSEKSDQNLQENNNRLQIRHEIFWSCPSIIYFRH